MLSTRVSENMPRTSPQPLQSRGIVYARETLWVRLENPSCLEVRIRKARVRWKLDYHYQFWRDRVLLLLVC